MELGTSIRQEPGKRVTGGYVFITVQQVLMAWHLYSEGTLGLRDLRVWFGLFEMKARRAFTGEGRTPRYRLQELGALLGDSRGVRASVRRLTSLGLATVGGGEVHLAASPDELRVQDLSGFWERLSLVPTRTQRIPLPRRVLRFIVGGTTKVETACILGHAIRCLFARKSGAVSPVGVCKSTWVEDVFEVNASRVRHARSRLETLGLLRTEETDQRVQNRWGSRVAFNLAWSGTKKVGDGGAELCRNSQHPPLPEATASATPKRDSDLPTEREHQIPEASPPDYPTGVSEGRSEKKPAAGSPSLRHVLEEDLNSTERMLALHEEAISRGLAPSGERGALEVLGLAEHARRYATRNAPGLFARLLHTQRWHFITQDDEDLARARLREMREKAPGGGVHLRSVPIRVGELLSGRPAADDPRAVVGEVQLADVRFVRDLLRLLASKGIRDSEVVFRELSRTKPEWTRERWEKARHCRPDMMITKSDVNTTCQ